MTRETRQIGPKKPRQKSVKVTGKNGGRPGLDAGLKSLRQGDVLVIWKLDRLGRSLHHLVRTVSELSDRGVGLKVLTGQGAQIDTTTAAGLLSFGIFASLAEFESELIKERTMAGLQVVRSRGRKGGGKFVLTKAQVRMAQAAMANRDTSVAQLCDELGVKPVTLYRYVDPREVICENTENVSSPFSVALHTLTQTTPSGRACHKSPFRGVASIQCDAPEFTSGGLSSHSSFALC